MGLDGGTFVTRSDILRRQSSRLADADTTRSTRGGCIDHHVEAAANQELLHTKYCTCFLTGEPLSTAEGEVVVCRKGRLYNKTAFHDYILREERFSSVRGARILGEACEHLRGPRDVAGARIAWLEKPEPGGPVFRCPISEQQANGTHAFAALWRCGCVMSRRVISMTAATGPLSSSSKSSPRQARLSDCPTCACQYDPARDVVNLFPANGTPEGDLAGASRSMYKTAADRGTGRGAEERPGLTGSAASPAAYSEAPRLLLCNSSSELAVGALAIRKSKAIADASAGEKRTKRTSNGARKRQRETKSAAMPATMPRPAPRQLSGGWEQCESSSKPGRFYFRNQGLGVTTWERPGGV